MHNTDDNVGIKKKYFFSVKTTISTGHVIFSVIGNKESRYYVIAGSPVFEVKSLNKFCPLGNLILTANAWEHCAPSNYEYVIIDETKVKVIKRENFILKNN